MANYGKTIQALRTKKGLTQTELGNELNVTYQAVSKWENDLSQPDLGTISAMCKLFEITLDQFIALSEGKEIESADAPARVDERTVEQIAQSTQEIVREEMERQRREQEEARRKAALAAQRAIEAEKEKERKRAEIRRNMEKHEESVKFRWGFWGGAVLGIGLIIAGIVLEQVAVGVLLGYLVWAMGAHLNHEDWWADEVFKGGWDWSWRAPGLIFTLDPDGCLFALAWKFIIRPLISLLLGAVVGLGGTILALLIAGIGMPFKFVHIIRSLKEGELD